MPNNVLPATWVVTDEIEIVPGPVDIGMSEPRSTFARRTTLVRNSLGQLVAASGDHFDAVWQALAVAQATEQPYDSDTWTHA